MCEDEQRIKNEQLFYFYFIFLTAVMFWFAPQK